MFENRVLRRIFGPKREEVTAGWERSHNEESHHLIKSRIRWVGYIAHMEAMRNAYNILVRNSEGKRSL
jgi:hypothetical protein